MARRRRCGGVFWNTHARHCATMARRQLSATLVGVLLLLLMLACAHTIAPAAALTEVQPDRWVDLGADAEGARSLLVVVAGNGDGDGDDKSNYLLIGAPMMESHGALLVYGPLEYDAGGGTWDIPLTLGAYAAIHAPTSLSLSMEAGNGVFAATLGVTDDMIHVGVPRVYEGETGCVTYVTSDWADGDYVGKLEMAGEETAGQVLITTSPRGVPSGYVSLAETSLAVANGVVASGDPFAGVEGNGKVWLTAPAFGQIIDLISPDNADGGDLQFGRALTMAVGWGGADIVDRFVLFVGEPGSWDDGANVNPGTLHLFNMLLSSGGGTPMGAVSVADSWLAPAVDGDVEFVSRMFGSAVLVDTTLSALYVADVNGGIEGDASVEGVVYVYTCPHSTDNALFYEPGEWAYTTHLTSGVPNAHDFGKYLYVYGQFVLVGAGGHVQLFLREGTTTRWTFVGYISAPAEHETETDGEFGSAAAVLDTTLLVGSYENSHMYIFDNILVESRWLEGDDNGGGGGGNATMMRAIGTVVAVLAAACLCCCCVVLARRRRDKAIGMRKQVSTELNPMYGSGTDESIGYTSPNQSNSTLLPPSASSSAEHIPGATNYMSPPSKAASLNGSFAPSAESMSYSNIQISSAPGINGLKRSQIVGQSNQPILRTSRDVNVALAAYAEFEVPISGAATNPFQYTSTPSASDSPWEIDYNEIELGPKLGEGSFGVVYKALWRCSEVAVKMLLNTGLNVDDALVSEFRAEAALMQRLRPHTNLVLFMGICSSPHTPLCIVTEFCVGGSLDTLLQSDQMVTMCDVVRWNSEVASGVTHLHAENVIHRDLAARNILLGSQRLCKIGDLGMSRLCSESANAGGKTKAEVGPLKWMSPEAIIAKSYSEASDVWSLGIVMIECLGRAPEPYPGVDPVQVAIGVAQGTLSPLQYMPAGTPDAMRALMQVMFSADPSDRPTAAEIGGVLQLWHQQMLAEL